MLSTSATPFRDLPSSTTLSRISPARSPFSVTPIAPSNPIVLSASNVAAASSSLISECR